MPAPTLGEPWQLHLQELKAGWDSYKGKPITPEAIKALEQFSVVPMSNGGIQLEIHQSLFDIEIVIGPDGEIRSALVSCDNSPPWDLGVHRPKSKPFGVDKPPKSA